MAHCAHIPAFVLHQVTCRLRRADPVWSAQRLAGTVPLRLVGRNGVGKTRLLRLLAGLDSPAGGHIERAAAVAGSAAADAHAGDHPRYAAGLCVGFAALSRLEQGQGWPTISIC